jgi:hypothetical protein
MDILALLLYFLGYPVTFAIMQDIFNVPKNTLSSIIIPCGLNAIIRGLWDGERSNPPTPIVAFPRSEGEKEGVHGWLQEFHL